VGVTGIKFKEPIEDYLVTIYKLESLYGEARTSQIARELGVRDGTVSKVIKHLQEHGYVRVYKYRGVRLTEKGREVAARILRNHRILEVFLHDFLGFDYYRAHELAHKMEHLPQEVIDRIYEKLGKPDICVYGPPRDGGGRVVTLDAARPGACYRIVCIIEELNKTLSKLRESGCIMSCRVMIESKGSKGLVVRVEGGGKLILSMDEAKTIGAEEVSCDGFKLKAN